MEEKCLEFYFSEDEYNEEKEQELIKQLKKEERVKEVVLNVNKNEWGTYIVKANIYQRKLGTFVYDNTKISSDRKAPKEVGKIEKVIFTKPENFEGEEIKEVSIKKKEKRRKQTKYEKYTNKSYGKYESQGQFKPY